MLTFQHSRSPCAQRGTASPPRSHYAVPPLRNAHVPFPLPIYLLTTAIRPGNVRPSMETQLVPQRVPGAPSAGSPGLGRWFLCAIVWLGLLGFPARAELIYDNSTNNRFQYVSLLEEFGDEIDFFGAARTISSMAFSVLGETNIPPNATARFRIYKNNGPLLPFDNVAIPTPGELLFESVEIPLIPGTQTLRITDIAVPVPTNVTWTVLFRGAGTEPGTRAGLEVYHPPTVGASFRDYWVRGEDGFQLHLLDAGQSASFAARFEGIPDPPVTLVAEPFPEGTVVRVTGPIGTEHILETSNDGQHWRTLSVIRLLTQSEGSYFDTSAVDGQQRFYRVRPAPHPGSTVVLQGIRQSTNGVATLTFAGPRNTTQLLEASADQVHWKPVDVIYLFNGTATYQEKVQPGVNRFYRTYHPTGRGPVYLIRDLRRDADGSVVLACSGLPDLQPATIEATTNHVTWTSIGTIQFFVPQAEFRDTTAAQHPARSYRIRR